MTITSSHVLRAAAMLRRLAGPVETSVGLAATAPLRQFVDLSERIVGAILLMLNFDRSPCAPRASGVYMYIHTQRDGSAEGAKRSSGLKSTHVRPFSLRTTAWICIGLPIVGQLESQSP